MFSGEDTGRPDNPHPCPTWPHLKSQAPGALWGTLAAVLEAGSDRGRGHCHPELPGLVSMGPWDPRPLSCVNHSRQGLCQSSAGVGRLQRGGSLRGQWSAAAQTTGPAGGGQEGRTAEPSRPAGQEASRHAALSSPTPHTFPLRKGAAFSLGLGRQRAGGRTL